MPRTSSRKASQPGMNLAVSGSETAPRRPPLEQLKRQVDDIARRYDTPTPGLPMAPERVPDERADQVEAGPFSRWLVAQRDRGDWLDGLAEAARRDPRFPKNTDPEGVRAHLSRQGMMDPDVFEQVDDAEREWLAC